MVRFPVKPVHSKNMSSGILCTPLTMMSVPPQPSKGLSAELPKSAQLKAPYLTVEKPLQFLKALAPIEVTEFGMVRLPVKPLHS